MQNLSARELDCLRKIAQGGHGVFQPCPEDVIKRLLVLRLVEYGPQLRVPLELSRKRYRLTHAGETLLRKG